MLTVAVAPLAIVPSEHVTRLPLFVHVPWLEFAATKFNPAGNASVTVTLLAASGPRLVTVRLKLTPPLMLVEAGATDSPIARSAEATLPTQHEGVEVVMLRRQPCAMLPESPGLSSWTYNDQTPFGFCPLNRAS